MCERRILAYNKCVFRSNVENIAVMDVPAVVSIKQRSNVCLSATSYIYPNLFQRQHPTWPAYTLRTDRQTERNTEEHLNMTYLHVYKRRASKKSKTVNILVENRNSFSVDDNLAILHCYRAGIAAVRRIILEHVHLRNANKRYRPRPTDYNNSLSVL